MKTKKLFPVILVVIGLVIGFSVSYFGNFTRDRAGGIVAPKPIFEIDGAQYYESDLSEKMRLDLFKIRNENFINESYLLKAYALRLLLAKQNNVPMLSSEPPAIEKLIPLPKISDQDIDAFFKQTNVEFPKGTKKEDIYDKIKMGLIFNKYTDILRENLQKNKKNKKLEFYFKQPALPETEFTRFEKYPLIGDTSSSNELIVMTPFFCKTCLSVHNSVRNVVSKYPIKARVIYSYEKKESPDYVWAHAIYCLNEVSDAAFKEFYNRYTYNFAVNENPVSKLQVLLQDQVVDWKEFQNCLTKDNEFDRAAQLASLGVQKVNVLFVNGKMIDFEDDLNDIFAKIIAK